MSCGNIICLQEVDIAMCSAGLHELFRSNEYYPVFSQYSPTEGGEQFGNVIAFPAGEYKLINSGQVRIGKHIVMAIAITLARKRASTFLRTEIGRYLHQEVVQMTSLQRHQGVWDDISSHRTLRCS